MGQLHQFALLGIVQVKHAGGLVVVFGRLANDSFQVLWDRIFLDADLGAERLREDQDNWNGKWAGNELVRNIRKRSDIRIYRGCI
jgi:hypothetical protein